MRRVKQLAVEIVAREGGYVNDPADPGGATNFGVTLKTLRRLGLDLDGNGTVGNSDLRSLTAGQAADIFLRHYFYAPRIDRLPEILHPPVFDMYVNAGSQAVRILQKLLNEMDFPLYIDGVIGPLTIATSHRAAKAAPNHLADAYSIARRGFYYRLADQRAGLRKFARSRDGGKGGWIRRAESFLPPRFRLTMAQHRERVAAWG